MIIYRNRTAGHSVALMQTSPSLLSINDNRPVKRQPNIICHFTNLKKTVLAGESRYDRVTALPRQHALNSAAPDGLTPCRASVQLMTRQ